MDFSHLVGVDYVIISIIVLSILTGLFRGVVKELMALGIWVVALWSAAHFSKIAASKLEPWIHQPEFRHICAFLIIMVSILLLGGLMTSLLSFVISKSGLSGTDRLLGMAFGWLRGVLIISLIIVVAKITGFPEKDYAQNSKLYAQFNPVVQWMASYVPQWLSKMKSLDPSSHDMVLQNEKGPKMPTEHLTVGI